MVDIERVMMKNRRITIATTCEDKKMPLRSLNPILLYSRTNSCVSRAETAWLRRRIRAQGVLRSAPCSSSLLEFLKQWGEAMAWRIDEAVVRGEIDNRIKGSVTGKNYTCAFMPMRSGAISGRRIFPRTSSLPMRTLLMKKTICCPRLRRSCLRRRNLSTERSEFAEIIRYLGAIVPLRQIRPPTYS